MSTFFNTLSGRFKPAWKAEIARLERIMGTQQTQLNSLIADQAALKAALDNIIAANTTTAGELTSIATNVTALQQQIATLQQQQASGQPVDLTAALASADALVSEATSAATNAQANAANATAAAALVPPATS